MGVLSKCARDIWRWHVCA